MSNTTNATCLTGSALSQSFTQYVNNCRKGGNQTRVNNFFPVAQDFQSNFQKLRSQFDDMIMTGDSMSALANLSGATVSGADQQIRQLEEKKNSVRSEIDKYRRISESADRSFMDTIMEGQPKEQLAPTLQDITLLLFWFGWLVLSVLLVWIRWKSPGGGFTSGLFTLTLLLVATLCVYALLVNIA
jgi:hypothetical protein